MTTNALSLKVAEAAIGAVTGELYKDVKSAIVSFISETINYAQNVEGNHKKMKEAAKQLEAMLNDVEGKICRDGEMEATKVSLMWIGKVKRIMEEMEALESEYSNDNNSFLSRSDLSKQMEEKCTEICKCVKDVDGMEILMEKAPRPVLEMIVPKIEDKPSLYEVFKRIESCLADKTFKRIGLWGMLGVGKTTIMKHLNNNKQIAKAFDIVVFATLPDNLNEGKLNVGKQCVGEAFQLAKEKVQREIARRLKLNIKGTTNVETIASRIREWLKNKKYLLLLDNVWGVLELDEIGIPNDQEDSKVVLASRHRDICKFMDVDENVMVERLTEPEAMTLFREKLGRNVSNQDSEKVARLVVRHCSNLPLLIDKVAGFFKKKNQELWWPGVRNFQKWPYREFSGMEEVIKLLRFCFEELDNEEKKLCFLYSALHTEGSEIYAKYLAECCAAEGFVQDMDQGQIIVDDLVDVSLFEMGEKKKYVRMNRVLRNMALKISEEMRNLKLLVRAGEDLQVCPSDEEWKEAKRISLMDNRLHSLPANPNCTNLSTLFLQRNSTLTDIPEQFCRYMQNLRVLDLCGTKVATLPFLSYLTGLRALFLSSCDQLMELPAAIEALVNLQVLDIRGTRIYCLPDQIRCLRQLRCFRTSFSKFDGKSRKVEKYQNVFSNLFFLEELVIEVEGHNQWWDDVAKNITEELAALEKLNALSFCFPDEECLKIFITKSSLWKDSCFMFKLSVNYHYSSASRNNDYFGHDCCRYLKYTNGEGIDRVISELLCETYAFELIGHKGELKLSDFGVERINKLQICVIEGCQEIKTIIDANGATKSVLECLEKISIRNVPKLESIWEGPVPDGSLTSLTTLVLCKCSALKKIFSRGMIQQLSKLQDLRVEECCEIEEIIMESENGPEPITLPSLSTLVLYDLPKLGSISKNNSLKFPSLSSSKISRCPLLTSLPF